jgi:hypothetical protein
MCNVSRTCETEEGEPDPSQETLDALREVVEIALDENLLGDPALQEEFRRIKESGRKC